MKKVDVQPFATALVARFEKQLESMGGGFKKKQKEDMVAGFKDGISATIGALLHLKDLRFEDEDDAPPKG